MKMCAAGWILCIVMLLMPGMALADAGNRQVGAYLLEQYNQFTNDEKTELVMIGMVFFEEGMHMFVLPEHVDAFNNGQAEVQGLTCAGALMIPLMYRDDPQEKRLLTDASIGKTYSNYTSRWNAYEAGEYANFGIAELYRMGCASGIEGRMPISAYIYEGLLDEITQLVGLDSAYMTGTMPVENGIDMRWDVLPFFLLDPDEQVLDESIYVYCRMIEEDEMGDTVVFEYYVSEREAVCGLLKYLLNQNKEISRSDREMMTSYIEYCGNMEN